MSDELKDKIDELDAATDELWDTKDKHAKKIEELKKEFSETHSELHDMITSYDDDINKISFHEQKIEALLRRVKNLEQKLNDSKPKKNTLKKYLVLSLKVVGVSLIFAFFSSYLFKNQSWDLTFYNLSDGAIKLFLSLGMTLWFGIWFIILIDYLFGNDK